MAARACAGGEITVSMGFTTHVQAITVVWLHGSSSIIS